jgi:hypothetical protein
MIPSFLLAKLYVKDSLKNTATGFEFGLKNIIDSTMLIGIGPISAGEKTYVGEEIKMTLADRTVDGTELSSHNPIPVHVGTPFKVSVFGKPLESGANKIIVVATTSELGRIKFEINETVS